MVRIQMKIFLLEVMIHFIYWKKDKLKLKGVNKINFFFIYIYYSKEVNYLDKKYEIKLIHNCDKVSKIY